ncbi:MAG: tRNA ((1)-)-methyltransferase, tRNA (guanine37-N1)-methyltransferase [Candidatus Parcubacteria bacterium]|jgi:tRNA (guanine37-N1)-methyltransferase
MTTFHIITLFPESFSSYFGSSIVKRAIQDKKLQIKYYNPRDYTDAKGHRVDQKPYGGGPGMVIEALPVIRAIEQAKGKKKKVALYYMSPAGEQFTNTQAATIASKEKEIVIVCGRYEGIDARVLQVFPMQEISVGPFVLTGGELGAMIMVDVIARQIPGVLGDFDSREEARIASHDVYTRPATLVYKRKKYTVPEVLLSGNHAKIDEHRSHRRSQA